MKSIYNIMTKTVRLFIAIGLASLLAGCTTPNGRPMGGSSLNDGESTAPGQTDSGLRDYREILSDPGPF